METRVSREANTQAHTIANTTRRLLELRKLFYTKSKCFVLENVGVVLKGVTHATKPVSYARSCCRATHGSNTGRRSSVSFQPGLTAQVEGEQKVWGGDILCDWLTLLIGKPMDIVCEVLLQQAPGMIPLFPAM